MPHIVVQKRNPKLRRSVAVDHVPTLPGKELPGLSAPRPVALVQRTVRCTVWTAGDSGWTPHSVVSCTNPSLGAAVMSSPVPTSGTLLPGQSAILPVGMVCKPEQLSVKLSRRRGGSCLDLCPTAAALRRNHPLYSAVTMETVAPPITGLWGHGGNVPHDVVGVLRGVSFSVSTSLEGDNLGNGATLSYDRRLNRTVTLDHAMQDLVQNSKERPRFAMTTPTVYWSIEEYSRYIARI